MSQDRIQTLPLVDWAGPRDQPLADLERQIQRGSLFTQAALDRLVGRLAGAESYLSELVGLLKARGLLAEGDLSVEDEDEDSEQPSSSGEAPAPAAASPKTNGHSGVQGRVNWPAIAFREDPEDPPPPAKVNCAERMHICHAVCCKLNFALNLEEVDSGKVKWDLGFPYMIRHGTNGYCIHNDTATGRCNIYADRPGVCHRYDCTNDPRIWKDFDNMVLNEEWIRENLANQSRITLRAPLPLMEVKGGNGAVNGDRARES
jgi:Fe-S-cluster containining protein